MGVKTAIDHVCWLFFPGRFLFGHERPRRYRVAGWETVRFVDTQDELRVVNEATGEVFLGGAGNEFLETLLGPQSVFCLDHDDHRLARRIAGGALTRITRAELTTNLDRDIDVALDAAARRWVTPLGRWIRALTMRTMCRVVLDVHDRRSIDLYFRRFESITGYLANAVSYSKRLWHPRGPLSVGAAAAHLVGRLDRVVHETIAERRQAGATGLSPLDALIRGQSEHGYNDGFIRDNVVALMTAGYETTGAAVAWMLYWLAQTDAYASLQARRSAGDRAYLEAFRNECLRFCPPVEILPRKVAPGQREAAAALLPDLGHARADETPPMVCPCVHRVHHDAAVHPDPERFEPERFLDRTYRPTEYLPFGLGPRFCLGASVGLRVMDRVLDRLLARRQRFVLPHRTFRPVRRNVSLWPGVLLWARLSHQEGVSHE